MAGSYQQGDLVRVSCAFTSDGTTFADPTTVALSVEKPDGTIASYTTVQLTKDSTGHYHYDVPTDQYGVWQYRFVGTGSVAEVDQGVFFVEKPLAT